jgi:hypothetical protein
MLLELTGVVRSGGRSSLAVPFDSRQGLPIVAGMSTEVLVRVVDQQGAPVDVSSATVILTVKKSPRNLSPLLVVNGEAAPQLGRNVVIVTLPAGQTASWTSLVLCYDVVLDRLSGANLESIVPLSPLYVTPATYGGVSPGPGPTPTPSAVRGTVPAPGGPYPAIPAGTPVAIVDNIVLVVADASDPATMPAVGLYTGASTNLIRVSGTEEGLVGLPENAQLWVAPGGGVTTTNPSSPGQVSQRIGETVGTTNIFVEVGVTTRRL